VLCVLPVCVVVVVVVMTLDATRTVGHNGLDFVWANRCLVPGGGN
jgi:hypothetical protein